MARSHEAFQEQYQSLREDGRLPRIKLLSNERAVEIGGKVTLLPPSEWHCMVVMASNPGEHCAPTAMHPDGNVGSISQIVARLRRKLGDNVEEVIHTGKNYSYGLMAVVEIVGEADLNTKDRRRKGAPIVGGTIEERVEGVIRGVSKKVFTIKDVRMAVGSDLSGIDIDREIRNLFFRASEQFGAGRLDPFGGG